LHLGTEQTLRLCAHRLQISTSFEELNDLFGFSLFLQKKMANVIKKAGVKGQICMIVFLLALFIILVILVFET
jgi:hypothetical protein